jgi:hypothetical protein
MTTERKNNRDQGGKFSKRAPEMAPELLREIGATGLKEYSGYLYEEWHPDLRGRLADKVYREMAENNPTVGAALFLIETLVRQVEWRVETWHTDSREARDLRDWFDGALFEDLATPFDQTVAELIGSLPVYGWALIEELYRIRRRVDGGPFNSRFDDGHWGWQDFAIRSQDSRDQWIFDESGRVTHMVQRVETEGTTRILPLDKCLLFRVRQWKNSPEGRSVLRSAYRPWYMLTRLEEVEAIGHERNAAGLPVALVPPDALSPNATPAERAMVSMAKDLVRNVRQDSAAGVVFPGARDSRGNETGFEFKLLSASGKNDGGLDATIKRHQANIGMALLAELQQLGFSSSGSRALGDSKTDVLTMAIGALLKSISDVFSAVAIPRLARLNGFPINALPHLTHGDVETPQIAEASAAFASMVSAGGLTWTDDDEDWYRDRYGLPSRAPNAGRALGRPELLPGAMPEAMLTPAMPALEAPPEAIDVQPETATPVAPEANAADTALNGAQVQAALGIVQQVAAGQLPRDAALGMLQAFFNLDASRAEQVMGSVGRGFLPTPASEASTVGKAEGRYADIDFSPPEGARDAAQRGLDLRREYGRGGTAVGIARARDLARGADMSPDTVRRMVSFFARHAQNRGDGTETPPSNGYIAWLLWGGDAGLAWATKVAEQMDARDEEAMSKADAPAPKEDQITGSDVNPEGSAAGAGAGRDIELDEPAENAIRNALERHNEEVGDARSKQATMGMLRAVWRRGAGAFSVSHRPGMTRQQWAMARVNAFLDILRTGKPENERYIGDNDLLPEDHPRSTRNREES